MFRKILMPIDLQDSILAEKAIRIAVKETREEHGELYVLSVVHGFGLPIVASFFPDNRLPSPKPSSSGHRLETGTAISCIAARSLARRLW